MPIPTKRPAPVSPLFDVLEPRRLFAFGVTSGSTPTGQTTLVIDNGGNVKFSVINGGTLSSTIHLGDMSSLQYKSKELLAPYSTTSRYSHYEQGLGAATITTASGGATGSRWILVTCDDSAEATGGVIQYYAVRENDNNLYLLSLPTDVNNGPGEGRYIAYLSRSVFTTPEVPTDNAPHSASDVVSAIEGSDVFGHTDGAATVQTTSSKFYGMGRRMIDNVYHGLTGSVSGTAVGAYMFMGNREHSAGGPFMKDIDYQSQTGDIEIYNCIFTGHTQTEAYRQGLHTYALQLTNGSAPAAVDYSWLETLKDSNNNFLIGGLIPASARGAIAGTASGMVSGHQTVIGLDNAAAQYWAYANATTGAYTINGVQPGTYTETIYDNELEVGTKTVTITAGQTTSASIVNSFYTPSNAIFRIGTFDGTPIGFLNTDVYDTATGARRNEIMHPSDVRMTAWDSTPNFVVGTNTDAQWPAYQFMGVNNSQKITFNLTAAQVQNLTLRIGITWGFSGARPKITVNAGQTYAWTSTNPTASTDLNSRGITRGTWRGVNQMYNFPIPSSALRAGVNTIDVPLISGSYAAGQTWLSPNVSYDAIDLVPTTTAATPAIASVTVTPVSSAVGVGGTTTFTAVAKDASGNVIPANIDWSAAAGTVDANGNFVAPSTPGSYSVTAVASETQTPGYSSSSSSTSTRAASVTASGGTTILVLANAAQRVWYKANETAGSTLLDAAGNNLAATLTGSYAYTSGVEGTAVKFTGGSASLPTGVVNGLNDFTIGAWVKPDATQSWARVFDLGTGTTAYMFFTPRTNTGVSRFAIKSSAGVEQTVSGPALAVGAWTHVAVSLVGNTATLYLNGVAVATNTGLTTHPAALGVTTSNYLGKSQFTADPALLGSVDDFRLYGSGLSATEINTWYKSGLAPGVATVLVDDGTAQRSMVRSVTLTFDQAVLLDASAFTLLLNGTPVTPTLTVTPAGGASTQYTVSFSGAGTTGGSLDDGRYQLVLNGASITNANGVAVAGSPTYSFFRLYGDVDGSATVTFNDFLTFQNTYGRGTGQTGFVSGFDGNGDGLIDFNDYLMFQNAYGKTV